jgi:hypothetical protein
MKELTDEQIADMVSCFEPHLRDFEKRELTEMRAVDRAGGHERRAKQLCEEFRIVRRVVGSQLCHVWDVQVGGKRYAGAVAVRKPDEGDDHPDNKMDREALAMQASASLARVLGLTVEMPRP